MFIFMSRNGTFLCESFVTLIAVEDPGLLLRLLALLLGLGVGEVEVGHEVDELLPDHPLEGVTRHLLAARLRGHQQRRGSLRGGRGLVRRGVQRGLGHDQRRRRDAGAQLLAAGSQGQVQR